MMDTLRDGRSNLTALERIPSLDLGPPAFPLDKLTKYRGLWGTMPSLEVVPACDEVDTEETGSQSGYDGDVESIDERPSENDQDARTSSRSTEGSAWTNPSNVPETFDETEMSTPSPVGPLMIDDLDPGLIYYEDEPYNLLSASKSPTIDSLDELMDFFGLEDQMHDLLY